MKIGSAVVLFTGAGTVIGFVGFVVVGLTEVCLGSFNSKNYMTIGHSVLCVVSGTITVGIGSIIYLCLTRRRL